jgi:DNA (cytosine-5)-methyltransferase 1
LFDSVPDEKRISDKPLYSVPSMEQIRAIPWNGFKVASTFSGCGGSCTGYRMAGFKVVWANEFVPIAQESYKANAAEDCYLDPRDIKVVMPEDILAVTGLQEGELDLFDGSPPCQAFSTAGKRHKGWGKAKAYEHGATQCNETLFTHYIRLLRGLRPKTFVAENVSGLVKGTAKGYFLEILAALKASGYRVTCKVLDAQWLGVPQSRQRTIFVGVREDLNLDPVHPNPLPYRYSVRDAIPWILKCESGPTGFGAGSLNADRPAPAVPASMQSPYGAHIVEAEADISRYAIGKLAATLKSGEQHAKRFSLKRSHPERPSQCIQASQGNRSFSGVLHPTEQRKFSIAELKRICAFPDDFILKGTYAQQWERLGNSVPPVMMKHIAEVIRDKILAVAGKKAKRITAKAKPPRRGRT